MEIKIKGTKNDPANFRADPNGEYIEMDLVTYLNGNWVFTGDRMVVHYTFWTNERKPEMIPALLDNLDDMNPVRVSKKSWSNKSLFWWCPYIPILGLILPFIYRSKPCLIDEPESFHFHFSAFLQALWVILILVFLILINS